MSVKREAGVIAGPPTLARPASSSQSQLRSCGGLAAGAIHP
jgi:hypothetical protein